MNCKTCGMEIEDGEHCTNCWEVHRRAKLYLESANGRAFMKEMLDRAESKLEAQRRVEKLDNEDEGPYEEHDKLRALKGKNQVCGEFLDWLRSQYELAVFHKHTDTCWEEGKNVCGAYEDQLIVVPVRVPSVLALYFAIDEKKLEDEKREMLADLRNKNLRSSTR